MNSSNVISLGEALIDRLGPIGGDHSFEGPFTNCFGGAPANVACALARLGVKVSFIGSLGNDEFGLKFRNLMNDRGINISGLQIDESRPTRVVLVRRDANAERSFGGFEGDQGLGFADQAISIEHMLNNWKLISKDAKWLIVGTIPLASEISSKAFLNCIEKAMEDGIKIVLDLNWRPTFWRKNLSKDPKPTIDEINKVNLIAKKASILKLAKEEAEWFFNSSQPIDISLTLPQRPSVIITDGANPVSWLINKNSGISDAILPSSIIDTTGAGDAFTSGLVYKLLSVDFDQITIEVAEEIVQFAIACGAYVCQGLGAIDSQPYLYDVEKLLSRSMGGTN